MNLAEVRSKSLRCCATTRSGSNPFSRDRDIDFDIESVAVVEVHLAGTAWVRLLLSGLQDALELWILWVSRRPPDELVTRFPDGVRHFFGGQGIRI